MASPRNLSISGAFFWPSATIQLRLYRAEGIIHCRGGDPNGYHWYREILAVDDEDAKEFYLQLVEYYRLRDHRQKSYIFVSHILHRLIRIDSEETTEIEAY